MPHRRHILVVDDNPDMVESLIQLLSLVGAYRATGALDGASALSRLATGGIDLVLVDWKMPGMSGLDVLKAIKLSPDLHLTPVVLMTGEPIDKADLFHKGVELGADHFLLKPFDPAALLIRVAAVLDRAMGGTHGPEDYAG